MGTFNTYGQKKRRYGGANPVWLTVSQKERSGGVISPLPPVGTLIPAGTLVGLEQAGGKATIIRTYYVTRFDNQTGELYLRALERDFKPEVGMKLMKPPTNLYPSGFQEQVASAFVEEVEFVPASNEYKMTCHVGGAEVGTVLMEAIDYPEGGFGVLAMPTGLTENDVWIEEGDEFATVASVYHGEIMEDRIQPIPQCVKNLLPMIKFIKGV